MSRSFRHRATIVFLLGISLASVTGCSRDIYSSAHVTGKVLCNGKPATGGVVIFIPVDAPEKTKRPQGFPGRQATGMVGEDGSFIMKIAPLGNDAGRNGALTGPHTVEFQLPQTEPYQVDPGDEKKLPPEEVARMKAELEKRPIYKPLECGDNISPATVEVKAGSNTFDFTLQVKSAETPEISKKQRRRGAGRMIVD
jgi:hypothetical protein